ncbi:hypothetical protein ACVWWJ_003810 [Luteibacter sp. HA06]
MLTGALTTLISTLTAFGTRTLSTVGCMRVSLPQLNIECSLESLSTWISTLPSLPSISSGRAPSPSVPDTWIWFLSQAVTVTSPLTLSMLTFALGRMSFDRLIGVEAKACPIESASSRGVM